MHHAFGEVNGKKGIWGHAIGGMGAITQAMARAARERGVEIELNAAVERVLVADGKATGVLMKSGETLRAKTVVSQRQPGLAL